jgi:DNA-binding PucR family transcriptional regulator
VVAFEIADAPPDAVDRAADVIALHCESYRRRAAIVSIAGVIYALLPASGGRTTRRRDVVADILERTTAALGVRIRAGIGSTVASLREASRSRSEADQVLRVLRERDAVLGDVDEVRAATVLLLLRDLAAADERLRSGRVTTLDDHDAQKGTVYVETLRAYLDAFGDIPDAAERAGVHPNTFRYRLKRLLELGGIDLDDPDERLVTELQLRFLR